MSKSNVELEKDDTYLTGCVDGHRVVVEVVWEDCAEAIPSKVVHK